MGSFRQTMSRFSSSKFQLKSRIAKSAVLCDIDGVLFRGREILPGARESINALYEKQFPTLFLTNQGLQKEEETALNLSKNLNMKIKPEQVVMSQSPLRLCSSLHDKFVLVLGQKDIKDTAFSVGFKNICQIEDIQDVYPLLDMVDKSRRYRKINHQKTIPKIEGILLLGEPVRWESCLQLVIDLLISNGHPSVRPPVIPDQHIPVLACNTDLFWMAEAPIPRFGHGAFLLCLESLFQKITGNILNYTMLTGKPFLVTYQYAERAIQNYLKSKENDEHLYFLDKIYVIGDNPDTDIYGGNLYKQYVKENSSSKVLQNENHKSTVDDVTSILVGTGIHSPENMESLMAKLVHIHKDILFDPQLRIPDHSVENIEDAVKLIISNEIS